MKKGNRRWQAHWLTVGLTAEPRLRELPSWCQSRPTLLPVRLFSGLGIKETICGRWLYNFYLALRNLIIHKRTEIQDSTEDESSEVEHQGQQRKAGS